MAIIFINGFNSKAGGGKSILNNYLSLLSQKSLNDNYIVLTPDKGDYIKYENNEISIIQLPKFLNNSLMQLVVYSFCLNKIIIKFKTDLVLNLADVPIRTSRKQIFLFDWAYAVYPESTVWKLMTLREWFHRKTKILIFKKYKKYIKVILAQTETIKNKLIKIYDFKSVTILPNAVSIDNLSNDYFKEFNLPDGVKLLYLTHYYSHKNIEIFIDLAKEIRSKDLDYKLIVTLEVDHNKKVSTFFNDVKKEGLDSIIYNVGSVEMKDVPSLYRQCDGLLMPTLLESFSGTYVEAMFHNIPIFTSNFDFARDVCKDGAMYFDPFDVQDIIGQLNFIFCNDNEKNELLKRAKTVLSELPDWPKVIAILDKIIKSELNH